MNIVLLTKNSFKSKEIKKIISGYGLKLQIFSDYKDLSNLQIVEKLKLEDCVLIREKTQLINKETEQKATLEQLEVVEHLSLLETTFFSKGKSTNKKYKASVDGFIDLTKRSDDPNIYNWDDIFVSLKTMKSYYEMRNTSGKFSARSIVFSRLLTDITKFEKKKDLNFNPFNQKSVIDFSGKIYDLIENNKYMKSHKNSSILSSLMNKVKNNGLFTRSSLDKKQRNYWYPALNAGLPLVSKKDEIHEITFMFHDLMHHLIPDLIHTGNSSELHKEAYVIHRMLSESFTIVLADMIFIDELAKDDNEYDFDKRKIYPLYKSMNIKELTIDKLKEIVWSNVNFALLGNEELLRKKASKEATDNYVNKFKKFFIEDYRWTINNFNNMDSNKDTMKKWFNFNKDKISKDGTIDYYAKLINSEMTYENKVAVIFDKVWQVVESAIVENNDLEKEKAISDAFKRYMIGQSILFSKNDFEFHSKIFNKLIYKELNKEILNQEDIHKVRLFFNLYVDKLMEENLISLNEGELYKEVVPLFEAYYVFYDSNLKYNEIQEILDKEFK